MYKICEGSHLFVSDKSSGRFQLVAHRQFRSYLSFLNKAIVKISEGILSNVNFREGGGKSFRFPEKTDLRVWRLNFFSGGINIINASIEMVRVNGCA